MCKIIILILVSSIFSENAILPKDFLKDLGNNKVNIYDFLEDGPIVINFWFLACEPCKKEMVYLNNYNKKYSKYGFKVLSINTDNSRTFSRVKPFVSSKKYSFTILSDPKSLFFRKVGGIVCPYSLVIDKGGEIINKHIGYNPGDEIKLEKEIVSILLPLIKSDTTLTDSSIISLVNQIELEKKASLDVIQQD